MDIQQIINGHLDMYLPASEKSHSGPDVKLESGDEEQADISIKTDHTLEQIKEEEEDEELRSIAAKSELSIEHL